MIILGIGHKARHGKDTAANAILDYYGWNNELFLKHNTLKGIVQVQRIGFADALYEMARNEYGMKEKDSVLLQQLGSEKRAEDPDYWVNRLATRISPKTDVLVIPDTRYRNEAAWIKASGGYVLKITRLNADGTPFVDPSRPADHPSETDLENYRFDFEWKISDGHQALTGELAVTLVEYLRGLHK
jgi:hypothetical protein